MPEAFFNFGHPEALQALWLLVPLTLLFAWELRRRNRVLQIFIERSLLDDVSPRRSVARPIMRFAVLVIGIAMLIIALARPRWDPRKIELEQQGYKILFCLDVSNSMRARDVDPSRLEAAKAAVRRLVDELPAGNQVGLLAYAGSAELMCPITPNYQHFLSVLDRVDYNCVDVGGTNLGEAIQYATTRVFGLKPPSESGQADAPEGEEASAAEPEPAERTELDVERPDAYDEANVLVVLSDGESHLGFARETAEDAHQAGVGIYIIGLGTEQGAPIPIEVDGRETVLKYKGETVITKFDDASLRGIVSSLEGRSGYLAAGAANVDLVDIYRNVIAKQQAQLKKLSFTVWQEKFQLFAGLGTVLVIVSTLMSEQRPVRKREAQP